MSDELERRLGQIPAPEHSTSFAYLELYTLCEDLLEENSKLRDAADTLSNLADYHSKIIYELKLRSNNEQDYF